MMDLMKMLNLAEIQPSNTKLSNSNSTFSMDTSTTKEDSNFANIMNRQRCDTASVVKKQNSNVLNTTKQNYESTNILQEQEFNISNTTNKNYDSINIIKKQDSNVVNATKKEDKLLEESPKKRVEVDKKEKDDLIKEIEEKIDDKYDDKDKFNILNIGLLLNILNNDKELNIEYVKLVPIQQEEFNEDMLGVFPLKDSILGVPITLSDKYGDNTSDILEDIKNKVDLVLSELDMEHLTEPLNKIFETQEDVNGDTKSNIFINSEDFDIEDLTFSESTQLQDEMKNFKEFLMSQRLSQLEIKSNNNLDNDLESLIKRLNSDIDMEVNTVLNPNSYGLSVPISDTIESNVIPEIIQYNDINKEISQVVHYMKTSDIKELTLKVKPKELGEITIHLLKGHESNIVISVEKEQLFNSLKHNLILINNELKDLGFNVDNIEILMKSNEGNNPTFTSNFNKGSSKNQSSKSKQNGNKANDKIENINENTVYIHKETDSQVDVLA